MHPPEAVVYDASVRRRSPLGWFLGGVALIACAMACSGAETQDVLAASSASAPSSSGDIDTPGSSGAPGSSGNPGNPGTPTTPSGCTNETEPNDDEDEATAFSGQVCGSVTKDGDARDYVTFTLKPSTRNLSINFSGRIRLTIEVAEQKVEITADDPKPVPVVRGGTYLIQVEPLTDGASAVAWRIIVDES